MTFLEIDREIEQLFDKFVDEETGEIIAPDECVFMAKLDELYDEKERKIDSMVGAFKYYSALADGIKAEKMLLAKRQQTAENRANSIKEFLSHLLNGEKVEKPQYKISWRKSVSAVVEKSADELPDQYTKTERKVDLTAIKSALKEGAEIDGCRLEEKNNITIK